MNASIGPFFLFFYQKKEERDVFQLLLRVYVKDLEQGNPKFKQYLINIPKKKKKKKRETMQATLLMTT